MRYVGMYKYVHNFYFSHFLKTKLKLIKIKRLKSTLKSNLKNVNVEHPENPKIHFCSKFRYLEKNYFYTQSE